MRRIVIMALLLAAGCAARGGGSSSAKWEPRWAGYSSITLSGESQAGDDADYSFSTTISGGDISFEDGYRINEWVATYKRYRGDLGTFDGISGGFRYAKSLNMKAQVLSPYLGIGLGYTSVDHPVSQVGGVYGEIFLGLLQAPGDAATGFRVELGYLFTQPDDVDLSSVYLRVGCLFF